MICISKKQKYELNKIKSLILFRSLFREGLLASQATVTVAPVFSSNGQVSDLSGPAAGDTYVVNPRTPAAAPSNAVRRNYRGGRVGRFQARQGREDEELLNFSDFDGMSSNHHYNLNNLNNMNNMNNQYYQSFQNHRVKRHEEEMKKTNLGEVNTNSSLQVREFRKNKVTNPPPLLMKTENAISFKPHHNGVNLFLNQ